MPQKPRSHFSSLVLLLIAYGLAAWAPAAGIWLREVRLFSDTLCPGVQVQHGLLALMLVCAGLSTSPIGISGTLRQSGKIALVTALSWFLPAVAGLASVVAMGFFPGVPLEIRLAILIVSAMPVANSTAAWANQLGANMTLSLSVLIIATMLSPIITAPLINLGTFLSGLQRHGIDALPAWGNDMSTFFAMWVLIPIIVGIVLSQFVSVDKLPWFRRSTSQLSLLMLLALNYINGTVCLPGLIKQPTEFLQPLMAATVLVTLIFVLYGMAKLAHRKVSEYQVSPSNKFDDANNDRSQAIQTDDLSLLLAIIMRNTGAAMVYTSTALASVPLVSLVVVIYTLVQHLLIGLIVSWPRRQSIVQTSFVADTAKA